MIRKISFLLTPLTLVLMFSGAGDVLAQRGGPGWGGRGGSALSLLSDENVQKELEIVEDQSAAIEKLQEEMRASMGDMFSGMRERFRDMNDEERQQTMTEIREKMATNMKQFDEKAFAELLPIQVNRLKQLQTQSQGRRGGGIAGGNLPESLVKDLNITDEQMAALKAKADEVRKGMEEKIKKLRAEAENEILSVLDSGQREKYKEIVGESFNFGNGGGRGRGRWGGRGGPRGPRGDRTGRSHGPPPRGGEGGPRGDRAGRPHGPPPPRGGAGGPSEHRGGGPHGKKSPLSSEGD